MSRDYSSALSRQPVELVFKYVTHGEAATLLECPLFDTCRNRVQWIVDRFLLQPRIARKSANVVNRLRKRHEELRTSTSPSTELA
jgi:hypothetical protein